MALARQVDAIYHAGSEVNFVATYQELKAANVRGTEEVLRLACAAGATPVHYVSTLSVFPPPSGAAATVYEDDALAGAGGAMAGGYAQSKWAAEQLVRQARTRGLPASIYRLGLVTGDSVSGAWQPGDALSRAIKACIQLGAMPDLDVPLDMTPVDYVVRALVALSLSATAPGDTYHLANPHAVSLRPLMGALHAAGYGVRREPYAEWRRELVAAVEELEENALAPLIPLVLDTADPADLVFGTQRVDDRHARAGLADTDIACPVVDEALMGRALAYWKRRGFLPASPAGSPSATPARPTHGHADGTPNLADLADQPAGSATNGTRSAAKAEHRTRRGRAAAAPRKR
jgi:thioester reductase-like protein